MVDPEALVLVSLTLCEHEPRLADFLSGWAAANSSLLSIQRMRNLAADYLPDTRHRLVEFARTALDSGKDHRWKALLAEVKHRIPVGDHAHRRSASPRKNRTRITPPRLNESSTLLLRLRLGIGVGIKADALAVLLGLQGDEDAWASVRVLAAATGYTDRAVRSAVEDMAAAGLIDDLEIEGEPIAYRATGTTWARLLEIEKPPRWCHWHERFTFVVAFLDWAKTSRAHQVSRYALGALGRELIERHRAAFDRDRVVLWKSTKGGDDPAAFIEDSVNTLSTWIVAHA